MDRSSLCFVIKKEHGKHYIVKRPTTTTTFSSLFSSLKNNNDQQNHNDVLVTEDDCVCLHFSLGDPSCPECDYHQQLATNNKKRKRRQQPQTLKKNKKAHNWVCEKEDVSANSSLCFVIKKVQGNYSIHPTRKQEQHNNNNNPSSSSVLTQDVIEDDRVCLHFSVGDPSCPQCDYQQQLTNNDNNKRKRPQQPQALKMNKKTRIIINNWEEDEEEDDHSICLHLLLGSSSCIPTCCLQTNNNIAAAAAYDHQWEIKKVLENSDVCRHLSRLLINKDDAQKFIFPVLLGGAEAAKTKQGVPLQVHDVDTDTLHPLFFKYWISAKSHIFTKRWVKDFVNRRDLKKGDQIGLRWDQEKNRFEFSVLGRAAKVVE